VIGAAAATSPGAPAQKYAAFRSFCPPPARPRPGTLGRGGRYGVGSSIWGSAHGWRATRRESVWADVSFFKWWEVVGAEAHFRVWGCAARPEGRPWGPGAAGTRVTEGGWPRLRGSAAGLRRNRLLPSRSLPSRSFLSRSFSSQPLSSRPLPSRSLPSRLRTDPWSWRRRFRSRPNQCLARAWPPRYMPGSAAGSAGWWWRA
jgi:hypothetical protein